MRPSDISVVVWVSYPGSMIRRKVFVRVRPDIEKDEWIDSTITQAASDLHSQGIIPEERFPLALEVFSSPEETDPVGARTVDMAMRPVFTVS